MSQKGPKMKIDIPALEGIIVAANRLKNDCETRSQTIRQTCLAMESEESLTGGEGDTIREAFQDISTGITNIENSIAYAVTNLNTTLDKAIKMQKGRMAGTLQEDTKQVTNKAGVFKKN